MTIEYVAMDLNDLDGTEIRMLDTINSLSSGTPEERAAQRAMRAFGPIMLRWLADEVDRESSKAEMLAGMGSVLPMLMHNSASAMARNCRCNACQAAAMALMTDQLMVDVHASMGPAGPYQGSGGKDHRGTEAHEGGWSKMNALAPYEPTEPQPGDELTFSVWMPGAIRAANLFVSAARSRGYKVAIYKDTIRMEWKVVFE